MRQKRALTSFCHEFKSNQQFTVQAPPHDDAFRLAVESRNTQDAARQLGVSSKLLYKWQKALQSMLKVGSGEGGSAKMR